MNLLLFETEGRQAFVVLERLTEPDSPYLGVSWWQRLKRRVHNSYQKLKEKFDHTERVCSNLRRASFLRVYHSPGISSREAEDRLRHFLRVNQKKHKRWLWVDAFLALAGSLLTWIPGPNIFFFYPAVRAMSHYFANQGARRGQILDITFQEESRIDMVQTGIDNPESVIPTVYALQRDYNVERLDEQLKHLRKR